jgi:aminodeoxychorismate lyase
MIVFLNGRFVPEEQALVSVLDRSFLYGDGLFETVLVANSVPFRWSQHLARLEAGAAFLGITPPFANAELTRFAAKLIHENHGSNALLRLTLSRGVGLRGYSPRSADSPVLVMTLHELTPFDPALLQNWRLKTAAIRLPADQPLAQFKTCNKLAQVLARAEAEQAGADEALLANTDDFVVEGASSNLFWIEQGSVYTPPLASGILSGITRSVVMELCREVGLSVYERNVAGSRLLQAEAVFLSLSSLGIVQATCLDGAPLRLSPLTSQIHSRYSDLVRRETQSEWLGAVK